MHRNFRLAILAVLSTAAVGGTSALVATTATAGQTGSPGRTAEGAAPSAEGPSSAGSKPSAPADSKPGAPADSKPGAPASSKPSAPADSKPGAAPSSEPTTPQAGNSCPGATLRPNRHDLTAIADATICLVNLARISRHIPALEANAALDSSAALHSQEMYAHRFFGHDSASGQTPREQVLASGYGKGASDVAAAQAVAWGSGSEATPRAMVTAWMASPPHRALLLSSEYQAIGVGTSLGSPRGSKSGALYTADLAREHLGSATGGGHLPRRRSHH